MNLDTDSANVFLLLVGYPATIAIVVAYGFFQPWWRSAWGRALFMVTSGLSALYGVNLGYRLWGWEILAREGWLRVSVYAYITVGLYVTGTALFVTLWRARKGNR